MNNAAPHRTSFPTSWRGRTPGFSEFNTVLNLYDKPVLLIDHSKGALLSANSQFLQLTTCTLAETLSTPLVDVFPELVGSILIPGQERETPLNRRNRTPVPVVIRPVGMDNNNHWFLLLVTPLSAAQQQSASQQREVEILESILHLAGLCGQPDLDSSLKMAMDIGRRLLETNIVCVYQNENDYPQLTRIAAGQSQENDLLPTVLSPQNLLRMTNPTLWLPGKRVVSDLHRIARMNNLNFLASVPLGKAGATIGMLVVGDTSAAPTEKLMQYMDILAANITTVLEHYILASTLENQLRKGAASLVIHNVFAENAREGVILLKPDLTVLEMNPTAEEILGYAGQEVLGKRVENVLIGAETISTALKSALQGIPTHNLGNIHLHRRTGQSFPAHVQTIPVITQDALMGVVVILSDVSEHEQIRVRTQQLEQRALLGEVTAIFAHEVRNPINNISMGLQLMASRLAPDDPEVDGINRMLQDCTRLTHLMESVLSFSKPMNYKMEPTNVGELIHLLLERWKPRLARAAVHHYFHVDPDCPLIEGDARALEQVFTNLVSNSVQAMNKKGGGMLSIKVDRRTEGAPNEPQQVEVTVSDTGPGIPDEIRDRIFEPFVTIDTTHGTGLGLAITKRIVTAHRGRIDVNSFPGGTMFHVCLPVYIPPDLTGVET